MAAASVILVLAYVPDIEIKNFSPLGFDFNEGGELSVWGLLAGVLVYYAIRSGCEYWTDYKGWKDTYRKSLTNPPTSPRSSQEFNLVHGRNVMAAASVILVLAYVPDIEIKNFSPLGFDFNEGGELSVWGLLAGVLVYYAIRSGCEYWTDYKGWKDTYRKSLTNPPTSPRSSQEFNLHARRLNRKFLFLDVAPPAVMFLLALVATVQQVVPLVSPPPSPPPNIRNRRGCP